MVFCQHNFCRKTFRKFPWLYWKYKVSGCGFESRSSRSNFRYRACFVQASIEGRFTLNLYLTGLPSPNKYIVTYLLSFLDTLLKQLHESNVTYFNQQVRNEKPNRKGEEILVEVMSNIMLLMTEMRNVWKEKVPLMFEKKA